MPYSPYGSSGYKPASSLPPRRAQPSTEEKSAGRSWKNWMEKLQKSSFFKSKWGRRGSLVLGTGMLVIFFGFWFLMGDFRFMMSKTWSFAGLPFGTRTYLILIQDPEQIRPTGGRIRAYGEMTWAHGFYQGTKFHSVDGLKTTTQPPLVFAALTDDEPYTLANANFDPDLNQSKSEILALYKKDNPDTELDGVITMDLQFMEQWLALVGGVTLGTETLTADNRFETLALNPGLIPELGENLFDRSLWLPWRMKSTLELLAQGFDEKHLQASFEEDTGLARAFEQRNWAGLSPKSESGDFVAVNLANTSKTFSDRYLLRQVQYELDVLEDPDLLGNPSVQATVHVTLSHQGGDNLPFSGPYLGYLRVLAPLGSDVVTGGEIQEERDDAMVLADEVKLQPGETKTFSYVYRLPEYVWNQGEYLLHLHKQAGTQADDFQVIVRAPQGYKVASDEMDQRENVAFFRTALLTDHNLRFSLTKEDKPPRLTSYDILDLNTIELNFNQVLLVSPETKLPELTDTNKTDKVTRDTVTVEEVTVDGKTIRLQISGMSLQAGELYELNLPELRTPKGESIQLFPAKVQLTQNLPEPEVAPEEEAAKEPAETTTTPETPAENG